LLAKVSFIWNLSAKKSRLVFFRIKVKPLRVFFFTIIFLNGLRSLILREALILAPAGVVLLWSGRPLVFSPRKCALERLVTFELRFLKTFWDKAKAVFVF
jgi:hypothetical protein